MQGIQEKIDILPYRRDYRRYILCDSIALLTKGGAEKIALLKDLSARGAGVVADEPLQANEKLAVVISAPFFFDQAVSKRAAVVWCKKIDNRLWQAGLDFGLDNKIVFLSLL